MKKCPGKVEGHPASAMLVPAATPCVQLAMPNTHSVCRHKAQWVCICQCHLWTQHYQPDSPPVKTHGVVCRAISYSSSSSLLSVALRQGPPHQTTHLMYWLLQTIKWKPHFVPGDKGENWPPASESAPPEFYAIIHSSTALPITGWVLWHSLQDLKEDLREAGRTFLTKSLQWALLMLDSF